MWKQYKWKIIISSFLVVLPVLIGILLWERLPEIMTTHWGADGVADGQMKKSLAVFVPFLILLPVHWLCLTLTLLDKKNQNQTRKAVSMIFWIIPATSVFCGVALYGTALGKHWDITALLPAFTGLLFIVMGNYMPKIRQNRTLGVKLPWTWASEENWNKTHRLCGYLWVAGGALLLGAMLLPEAVMVTASIIAMIILAVAPIIYSYCLYRSQLSKGQVEKVQYGKNKVSLAVALILLIALAVLMFSGNVTVTYGETGFIVDSSYWQALSVEYDTIDSLEYAEDMDVGIRTYGFGSARLSLGKFRNEALGDYIRYSYTGDRPCVIVRAGEKMLVLGGENQEQTQLIYQNLQERIAE